MIYPSTRPLNRVLEFSSFPYIPGVTGEVKGVLELLREAGLNPSNGKYKSLLELSKEEMEKLITGIILRMKKSKTNDIIGDVFLIKFFNKLEDAREMSAMINACSRMGEPQIAIQLCLEKEKIKKRADEIYAKYRQNLISGIKQIAEAKKIQGSSFVIINAEKKIKDSIIGTIASILSNSGNYEEGTMLTALAQVENQEKIKISSRIVGKNGRNAMEILSSVI